MSVIWDADRPMVEWDLQSDVHSTFQITLEEFLAIAMTTRTEREFRAELWKRGTVTKKAKAKAAAR